jgi:hypothetical protein
VIFLGKNYKFCEGFTVEYRLLNDYRKKCIKDMNLVEAKRALLKFEDLKSKETLR